MGDTGALNEKTKASNALMSAPAAASYSSAALVSANTGDSDMTFTYVIMAAGAVTWITVAGMLMRRKKNNTQN